MCAVYAFMRRADDISDDESKTIEARRIEMKTWLEAWRASRAAAGVDAGQRRTRCFSRSAIRSGAFGIPG